uniref:B-cell receptor CD22 n=1 Tax=Seriola dumerili TaxID=41447 RepID=A0A3B4UAP4_SERDU
MTCVLNSFPPLLIRCGLNCPILRTYSKWNREITAEAGLCVVIPCSFTTSYSFTPQKLVWYKCEPTEEKCSDSDVIFHTNKNNIKIQSEFRGRVSQLEPDVSQRNCSIIINDLKESDSGSYQFRVNALTQKPEVTIPPLTEGQQTTLTCTAPGLCSGSDPQITWTWRGAGEKGSHITGNITDFKTESLSAVTQKHSSNLTFNPSAEHHGTSVTCKVSFTGNAATEETVTLNVTCECFELIRKSSSSVPSLFIFSSNVCMFKMCFTDMREPGITGDTTVKKGSALNLTCSLESFPPSLITWTKLGLNTNLHNGTNLQSNTGSARLLIPNVTAEDSGQYVCTAKHLDTNVTIYADISKNSRCEVQSELLTCVCITEGIPLPTIKWPLLKNYTEYSVITTVTNHTVNSTVILTVKDPSNTVVDCVSGNENGEAKMNLNIQKNSITQGGTCSQPQHCYHRPLLYDVFMTYFTSFVQTHIGQAFASEKTAPVLDTGPKDVEYASIDFSLLKRRSLRQAAKKQETAETEYAEIKKEVKEEREDDGGEEGEMLEGKEERVMKEEDEETKCCVPGEEEGEDMAVYSNVKDIMGEM